MTPATSSFRAQPEVVEQQRAALVRPPGFGKVVGEVLEEIAVVRPRVPAVRTARAVGFDQLGVERRQALFLLGLQVAADHVVQADAARGEIEAKSSDWS